MRHHCSAVFASLVIVLAGCQPAPEPPPAVDESAVRNEIDQARERFGEAGVAGDPDAFLALWTDDLHIMEPGIDMGAAEWGQFVRDAWSTMHFTQLELRSRELFVHGDVAYDFGEYDETVVGEDGEATEIAGMYVIRWEKGADGEWRLDRVMAGPREAPDEM